MGSAFIMVKLLSLYIGQQNPDEGQHLLMAYSLTEGGVPFKDYEGQSLGPLNAFYLAMFSFGSISFFTGRLAALVAELACGILIFFGVKKICGVRPAMALAAPVFFYFSIYFYDVIAYNSETLFCLLIALWFWFYAIRGASRSMLFAECFVLGLLPWIKLQFAPFSVTCFILTLARNIFIHDNVNDRQDAAAEVPDVNFKIRAAMACRLLFSKHTLYCGLAALAPTLLFALYLGLNGALKFFWMFYVRGNLAHVAVPFKDYLVGIGPYLISLVNEQMFWLAAGTAVIFMILALVGFRSVGRKASGKIDGSMLLALFALTALFSVTRTMSLFDHYLNILVPSCAIFAALGLKLAGDGDRRERWAFDMLAVAAVIFGGKLMGLNNIRDTQKYGFVSAESYPFKEALRCLNERVKPGEPIALWGWETGFPIYSDHPSATATHYLYPLLSPKFTHKMRDKYVQDILFNRPAAIADLVCPAAFSYKEKQYELSNYDFIRRVTDGYYEEPVVVPAGSDGFVRIYFRKPGR